MQAPNPFPALNSILANGALIQTNAPPSEQSVGDLLASRWLHVQTYYDLGDHLINTALFAAIALLIGFLIESLIRGFCTMIRNRHSGNFPRQKKIDTFRSILLSITRYTVAGVALINILLLWGVSAQSVTVGSAVLAGAIGFGSQGLIQDMITGFGLLFEDQLQVGDYVQIGDKTGYVREVGLRVVKLETMDGSEHIIFNRTISTVTNLKPPTT